MPLPLILAGAALLAGGYGVKKGLDAKSDFELAESIGKRAKEKHDNAAAKIELEKKATNDLLTELGKAKVSAFSHQIKHLVDVFRKYKATTSKILDFEAAISVEEMHEMERLVLGSLEIEKGLLSGASTGALAGLGAFGSVGALGAASTGTLISGLSGAAATNATLAWFGGGAISAGGLGMGVGAYALGGIVLGPALAVGGFMMAQKAEEAYTNAKAYEAKVDVAVAEIEKMLVVMNGIQTNATEMKAAIAELVVRFDRFKVSDNSDAVAFEKMVAIGRTLKGLLDIPIMGKDGAPMKNIKTKISGFLRHA